MANIAYVGRNRAAQVSDNERIIHLCKEEKATFDKVITVARGIFILLSPVLIPGKVMHEGLKTLNQAIDGLGRDSTSKTIKLISGVFKLIYAIPSCAAIFVLKPISACFDFFNKIDPGGFNYVSHGTRKAAKIGDDQSLKILLENKNMHRLLKEDASSLAVEHRQLGSLKLLLEHKPVLEIHVLGRLLEQAAKAGWFEGVKAILDQHIRSECDPELNRKIANNIHGGLCRAAGEGHHEIVELLKSQPGITDEHKDIARQWVKYGDVATSVLLLTDNVDETTHGEYLKLAAEQGLEKEVTVLLAKKISREYKGLALIKAASNGHAGVVKSLLETKDISHGDLEYAAKVATQAGYIAIANAIKHNN